MCTAILRSKYYIEMHKTTLYLYKIKNGSHELELYKSLELALNTYEDDDDQEDETGNYGSKCHNSRSKCWVTYGNSLFYFVLDWDDS